MNSVQYLAVQLQVLIDISANSIFFFHIDIRIIAKRADITPNHCLGASFSFSIKYASNTVIPGLNEDRIVVISSLPASEARVKNVPPPVLKSPARTIMGSTSMEGGFTFTDPVSVTKPTNINKAVPLAKASGQNMAVSLKLSMDIKKSPKPIPARKGYFRSFILTFGPLSILTISHTAIKAKMNPAIRRISGNPS